MPLALAMVIYFFSIWWYSSKIWMLY